MKLMKAALAAVAAIALTGIVSATATVNTTRVFVLDSSGTTPLYIWAGAIILGLVLILISFVGFPHGEEAIVSILAWIPTAYAMFTSFAVETVSGAGVGAGLSGSSDITTVEVHTIHAYPVIAVVLFIVLMFAIGNTVRIVTNQMAMRKLSQAEPSWHEKHMRLED